MGYSTGPLFFEPRKVARVVGPNKAEEGGDVLRQIGEMWDGARAELAQLREAAERAAQMGRAQVEVAQRRTEREGALLRLGEAFYKMVESGEVAPPAALKRAIGEVKAKDAELLRQQADIQAILKEADALAEKSKKLKKKK